MAGDHHQILSNLTQQPDNKLCADCSAPAPQWASVSHGIFICLNCSGTHRSLGVHLSFVRSVTLDKWSSIQVEKMRLGGNGRWKKWCSEAEGYSEDMEITTLYNTHFAAMYRDKLTAELENRSWCPADTPDPMTKQSSEPNKVRKPRTGASSNMSTPRAGASDRKAENEGYFASLGSANAGRSEALPPSQGGKYVGFGSNSAPASAEPAGGGWAEGGIQKGWGFLSSTIATLNDNVVKPASEKVADPELQSQVWSMAERFQRTVLDVTRAGSGYAAEGLKMASEQARARGYDLGSLGSSQLETFSRTGTEVGQYRPVGMHDVDQDDDEGPDHLDRYHNVGESYVAVSGGHNAGAQAGDWSSVAPLTAARLKLDPGSPVDEQGGSKARQGGTKPKYSSSGAKDQKGPKIDDGWDEW